MAYSVRASDLAQMTERERAEAASKLIPGVDGSANGRAEQLDDEIKQFERKYGISSEKLLEELYEGERSETAEEAADISRWLTRLHLRERVRNH